jgi:orotate phosphoribosyltransferase
MPADPTQDLALLKKLLQNRSVRFGEFTLVSGQKSNTYVDAKLTTCLAEAMPVVGRLFLRKMEQLGWAPDAVGGLTLGADPIAFAIAHESVAEAGRPIQAFVVRKEAKKHGMNRFIEGLEDTAGVKVVVIDDVCTSGGSTKRAIERAREAGMQVLGALCLVDRGEGAENLLREECSCALDSIFKLSDLVAAGQDSHGYVLSR